MQERAIQNEAAARCFNYMYSIIGFTFTLYCSIVAIFQDKLMNALNNQYIFLFLLGYALPIATYVLGLFYAYNAVAIYKFGYYSILLDAEIINLLKLTSKQRHIFRWGQSSIGEKSSPLIFAYGTMLMFYILLPPSMIVCVAFTLSGTVVLNRHFDIFFINIFPILFFAIYFMFMLAMIKRMLYFRSKVKMHKNKLKER